MRLPEPIEAIQVGAKFDRERRGVILSVMADDYQRRIVRRATSPRAIDARPCEPEHHEPLSACAARR